MSGESFCSVGEGKGQVKIAYLVSDLTTGWVTPFSATRFIPMELGGSSWLQTDLMGGINTQREESNGDRPQKMYSMRREES